MRAGRQKKKLLPDNSESLTPRERQLVALFMAMTEPDRRLLLSHGGEADFIPSCTGKQDARLATQNWDTAVSKARNGWMCSVPLLPVNKKPDDVAATASFARLPFLYYHDAAFQLH